MQNLNDTFDDSAIILGGRNNLASGKQSSVNGGDLNVASGKYSSISGGSSNVASGEASFVSGRFNCSKWTKYCAYLDLYENSVAKLSFLCFICQVE